MKIKQQIPHSFGQKPILLHLLLSSLSSNSVRSIPHLFKYSFPSLPFVDLYHEVCYWTNQNSPLVYRRHRKIVYDFFEDYNLSAEFPNHNIE